MKQLFFKRYNIDVVALSLISFVGFYYMAYRYPFMLNDSGVSPTYQDTPLVLKLGKYFILSGVLIFYICCSCLSSHANKSRRGGVFVFVSGCLAVQPIVMHFSAGSEQYLHASNHLELAFFFLVLFCLLLLNRTGFSKARLNRQFLVFLYWAVLFSIVQMALFLVLGRLPALAYENSLSVRFGSIWDSPNSFGVFLSFLIPFAYVQFNGYARYVMAGFLLILLLLTQSLTAIASFVLTLVLGGTLICFRLNDGVKWLKSALMFVIAFVVILAFAMISLIRDVLLQFLETKKGSIDDHSDMFKVVSEHISAKTILGVSGETLLTESAWITLFLNYGAFYVALFLGVLIYAIFKLSKEVSFDRREQSTVVGFYYFLICFGVASFNLPLVYMFPVNLFCVLGIFVALVGCHRQSKVCVSNGVVV